MKRHPMIQLAREGCPPFTWAPGKMEAVRRPEDVAPIMRAMAGTVLSSQEVFMVVLLNARHEIINGGIVTLGTLNSSMVHPRDVFRAAIHDNAAAVIVGHNHPSGDTRPSGDDLDLTRRLDEAGTLIGIALLDHLIVTENDATSIREYGWPGGAQC